MVTLQKDLDVTETILVSLHTTFEEDASKAKCRLSGVLRHIFREENEWQQKDFDMVSWCVQMIQLLLYEPKELFIGFD